LNKIIIICIVYSIFIIGGFYLYQFIYDDKKLEIEQGKAIMDKIQNGTPQEDASDDHDEHDAHDDAGYGFDEGLVEVFRDIESTLSFFVATLQDEHEPSFTSMFVPEQYSKDQWTYSENPYVDKVNYKFIRELNRNGTLVSAKYDTSVMDGYKTTRKDTDVELILIYEDGKKATLKLDLVLMGSEHSNADDIYLKIVW
jgi:uncharacterized protein YxeA